MSHLMEGNVGRLIKKAGRLIHIILFGLPTTIWLLLRDRHTVYYIPHIGLGDYCLALGYLESFKKQYDVEHITLLVPANRKEVARFYPCWDSLLVLKWPFYIGIACFGGIPFGRTIHRMTKRIRSIYPCIHLNRWLLYDNPALSMDGMIKLILKLPCGEERKAPKVPKTDIHHIVDCYSLPQGKTILLNPYTSGVGVAEIKNDFYLKMAKVLTANGFTVATILGSEKQMPISGTSGLVTSLAEAWYLAQWCGWVIGTRSGFFDFIRFAGCNIIGIYEPSYKLKEIYSLELPNREDHVHEYILKSGHEDEIIDKILSDCLMWEAVK